MGEAWGPRCDACPTKYSVEYQELCLESGFLITGEGLMLILNKEFHLYS